MSLLQSAQIYKSKGISVIATDNTKKSIGAWKQYQSNIATDQELAQMFSHPKVQGIACICGAVSGNLEVIDVDCKYGIKWENYAEKIIDADPMLYAKLIIVKTRSNGYHIYYRCEYIEGNQKLASRPATDDELRINPMVKQCVLIETRGEGGYVVAPPTAGYEPLQVINNIPLISIDERDLLISIARSFNLIIEEIKQPTLPNNNDKLTTWDDFNKRGDVVALLQNHGWKKVSEAADKIYFQRPGQTTQVTSAVLFTDKRIFYPHTTSTTFENKGYNPFGVYTHLECNGDWRKAAKQLSDVYGEKNTNGWFWTYSRNGAVNILKFALQKWLFDNYCKLYFHEPKSGIYRLIHEENQKVSEIYPENIKKFIKRELIAAGHEDVMEAIMKQTTSIFTDSFFEFIDKSEVEILQDTATTCYFPFRNGIITVTKDNISKINYGSIEGKSVWDAQINEFDIIVNNDYIIDTSVYYQFLSKICADDQERVQYAISLIGYVLHSYKDSSKPFAVILAEETDDEAKGGGTGKGIFFKAISKLIPTVSIDGKNFKPDKTFAFQRVTLGTKLVVIEDCPKNVEFERYYPTITEGMTIEKKNKDEIFLSFSESPKIAFTTNYSIAANAEHAKRRQKVLEFAPFFNSKNTPKDYFGHMMFDDWDNDEWHKFYNFMFYCVKYYLENGIKSIENSEKLNRKQLKLQFGEDFLDWWDDLLDNKMDQWLFITDEYKSFLIKYEMEKKEYSLKRFKKAIDIATQLFKIDYIDRKNHQNNGVKEFRITKNNDNYKKILTDSIDLF
jgi:hypothetical protein